MNIKRELEIMKETTDKNNAVDRNYVRGYKAGLKAGFTNEQWIVIRELLMNKARRANIDEHEELMGMVFKINQIVDLK